MCRTEPTVCVCAVCAPVAAAYVGSVAATLYAALILHSYLLCLLCSGLQVRRWASHAHAAPQTCTAPHACTNMHAPLCMHPMPSSYACTPMQALSKLMKWEWFLCVQVVALMYYLMSYFPGARDQPACCATLHCSPLHA